MLKSIMRFKLLGVYSGAAYLGQICNVLISVAFIRSLSAGTLGDIAVAKIWMQLLDYSHLGYRFALDRFGPVWPRERSKILLSICITVTSFISSGLAFVALITTSNIALTLCFMVAGYSVALATILKNHFRSLGETKDMLSTYLICPTVPLLIQALAILLLDFNAFLIASIVSHAFAGLYLLVKLKPVSMHSWVSIKRVIKLAGPTSRALMVSASVGFVSFAMDKVLLLHYTNKNVLGEYSIILFAFTLVSLVPNIFSEFIFPKIIRAAVKSGQHFFLKETLAVLAPTVLTAIVAHFIVPVAIPFFSNYEYLAPNLQLILWGIPPYAAIPILFHALSAHNMRRELLLGSALSLTIFMLILVYIGENHSEPLQYFINARISFGYILAASYASLLAIGTIAKHAKLKY